jgi:hypothetical protein
MNIDDADDARRRYEDEFSDHEAVESLLRPSVENAVSSNLMERNVEEEHSDGNVPDRTDRTEEDDDVYVRSENRGKGKQKTV